MTAQPIITCPDCGKHGRGKYWRKNHLCEPPSKTVYKPLSK
jgi:hypothetical protein